MELWSFPVAEVYLRHPLNIHVRPILRTPSHSNLLSDGVIHGRRPISSACVSTRNAVLNALNRDQRREAAYHNGILART